MPVSSPKRLSELQVFVVDGNLDSCILLTYALEMEGATVQTFGSVPQALEALNQFPPDMILTAIAIPGEDGYSLLRQVRQLETPDRCSISIFAITAVPPAEVSPSQGQPSFDQWLTKPVNLDELIRMIEQTMQPRRRCPGSSMAIV